MAQEMRLEKIDVERAFKYLEACHTNRKFVQANMEMFASLMRNKLFQTTSQGIAFDMHGRLVDGQHRLWAIVETKLPQTMWVARGLTDEQVLALDGGRLRTVSDVAHYDGVEADPMVWTLARILVRGIASTRTRIPYAAVKRWYDFYRDGIDYAIEVRRATRPDMRKMAAAMTAPFARAFYTQKAETLAKFALILESGQREFDADSGATVLRDAWLARRLGGETQTYYKTCSAIRAFCERRQIKTLQVVESEVFPIDRLPKELQYQVTEGSRTVKRQREKFTADVMQRVGATVQ